MGKNKKKTNEEREELVHELGYNLAYPQIESLVYIYNLTEDRRQYKSCEPKHRKYMADLIKFGLVEGEEGHSYPLDVLATSSSDNYRFSRFRITAEGISLCSAIIRENKKEMEQSKRDKLVKWSGKQAPIRPFLALIISILSLIISAIALYRSFL